MSTAEPDVRLHGGDLEAVVRPEFGGLISSFRWRGRELLDVGARRDANAVDRDNYVSGGLGGLDDCLPAIAPGTHPDLGAPIPDHGELWCRPAKIIRRETDLVVIEMAGERLPFVLWREIAVRPEGLRVDYALEHTGQAELPLVWAAHPLFAASPGMRLQLSGQLESVESSSPNVDLAQDGRLRTPAGDLGLEDWDQIPKGTCAKLFGPWMGPATVVHPAWGVSLTVDLEADLPAHLGLWVNRFGYPQGSPSCHLAIEPTFGDSDALDASIASGSCLTLQPQARFQWAVTYSLAFHSA